MRKLEQKKETLWTKNFTLITSATVLSVIGGEAMNLPISLLVFEKTGSTLLSAIIMICGMLPDVILPVLIAPIIDKGGKKKWIVGMDALMAAIFVLVGIWIYGHEFQYGLYLVFTLVIGTISVVYRLSYNAWYPDLITKGLEQKGYAVSSTIYPLITIAMAPIGTFLYTQISMSSIFMIVALLTVTSIILESNIQEQVSPKKESYSVKQYFHDIKEGFTYVKKEKGIRNIYTYMSITNGASEGIAVVTQAYYQTQPLLTVTMLGFLKSAEMIGRVIGGTLQYAAEVPVKKRYRLTKFVYMFYDIMDSILLFLPYPFMILNRFFCGALGTTSATIRESAVQSYLPPQIRARVQALFQVIFSLGGIVFQMLAGVMGLYLPYRIVALILGAFTFTSMILFIVIPAKSNRPIYEAERK
ncbi:MAG: MFS transporter [Lachnospiraceae bacterium]